MKWRNLLETLQAMSPEELDTTAAGWMTAPSGESLYARPEIKYATAAVEHLGIVAGQPLMAFTYLPDQTK